MRISFRSQCETPHTKFPIVPNALSAFLADKERRNEYFPHLKSVVLATHSHLFLDRAALSNNFVVSKDGQNVSIRQIANIGELHDLQFNLLGNSLDSLFLPAAIIIVEGKTDAPFVSKCVRERHKDRNIVVIEGQGDVKRAFRGLCSSLGDIYKSPFRSRTFIVLDSVHTSGTRDDLVRMGAEESNVIVWERNGIEFLYPASIMCKIFSCTELELEAIQVVNDEVSLNGIVRRKSVLSEEMLASLDSQAVLPREFEEKLLSPLSRAIGP